MAEGCAAVRKELIDLIYKAKIVLVQCRATIVEEWGEGGYDDEAIDEWMKEANRWLKKERLRRPKSQRTS